VLNTAFPSCCCALTSAVVCAAAIDPPKTITVAVTSDKGLCGGLNSNITKYTKALMQMYKGSGE
jgi:F0F1-type ATP synthase gamma subunit